MTDIVLPPTCIICQARGFWICSACERRLFIFHHGRCRACGQAGGKPHACSSDWPFASVTVIGNYADPVLRGMVTAFKYQALRCLQPHWRNLLRTFRGTFLDVWPWAGLSELTVTSIPPDPQRLRLRGIDHAGLLADLVRDELVPWGDRQPLLRRTRRAAPNALLPDGPLRAVNVQGAFAARWSGSSDALIVDDVLTTGATAAEAARCLLSTGTHQVHLLTLAQGSA